MRNLWDDDDEETIKKRLSQYSELENVCMIKDINGARVGSATVVFKDFKSMTNMLQKKDNLKPYDIIVFDPKAHRRNVLKEKRFENKDILKDGDNNTKTMSTSRKVVSWSTEQRLVDLSKENESNKIVSVNERSDNHRSNLKIQYHNNQKNCTNKSKEEKRSKGFEFVAEIHTPLNPKITAGKFILFCILLIQRTLS